MKRILHSIISGIFLLSILVSQIAVTSHSHNPATTQHEKGIKGSSTGDKCSICDMQNHNHLASHVSDVPFFFSSSSQTSSIYTSHYSGIKLVKSNSRGPPTV